MFYFVILIQTAINTGISIGAILLAGECLKVRFFSLQDNINNLVSSVAGKQGSTYAKSDM